MRSRQKKKLLSCLVDFYEDFNQDLRTFSKPIYQRRVMQNGVEDN